MIRNRLKIFTLFTISIISCLSKKDNLNNFNSYYEYQITSPISQKFIIHISGNEKSYKILDLRDSSSNSFIYDETGIFVLNKNKEHLYSFVKNDTFFFLNDNKPSIFTPEITYLIQKKTISINDKNYTIYKYYQNSSPHSEYFSYYCKEYGFILYSHCYSKKEIFILNTFEDSRNIIIQNIISKIKKDTFFFQPSNSEHLEILLSTQN